MSKSSNVSSENKLDDNNASGEVVNGFRSCRDLSDAVPFCTSRGIYLKPIAKINVSINLPQLKTPGKWSACTINKVFSLQHLYNLFIQNF